MKHVIWKYMLFSTHNHRFTKPFYHHFGRWTVDCGPLLKIFFGIHLNPFLKSPNIAG